MDSVLNFFSGRSDVVVIVFLFLGFLALNNIIKRQRTINEILEKMNEKEGEDDEKQSTD